MAVTIGYDGASLILRLPMDWQGYEVGRSAGSGILLEKVREMVDPGLITKAKKAAEEADELSKLIAKLKAERTALRPGAGVAGLVAQRRAQADLDEQLEAAKEIHESLHAVAEQAVAAIVSSIGGRFQTIRLQPPDAVASLLGEVEKQVAVSAPALARHLGEVDGFGNAVQRFNAREIADALMTSGSHEA